MAETKKKMEAEINDLKQDVDDLETALKKVWSWRTTVEKYRSVAFIWFVTLQTQNLGPPCTA